MRGADADVGQRVQQDVERTVEVQLHRVVAGRHGFVDHGQVGFGGRRGQDAVDGEGHVGGGQRLAVGEHGVLAKRERPGEAILAAGIAGGQVVGEAHVGVGDDERRLDERLVHVLTAAPRHERIEARRRLGAGGHGHDDLRLGVAGSAIGSDFRVAAVPFVGGLRAAGERSAECERAAARQRELRERAAGESGGGRGRCRHGSPSAIVLRKINS